MKRDQVLGVISVVCQVVLAIKELWGEVEPDNIIIGIFLLLLALTCTFIMVRSKKETEYMRFVEFLFDNNTHRFILLPKIRMYLHSRRINNKYKVDEMKVTYTITQNRESEQDKMVGDLEIIYSIKIGKDKRNGYFDFVTGNDFSNDLSHAQYKYGVMSEYQNMTLLEDKAAPYWRGYLGHFHITIEGKNIPVDGPLEIQFRICAERSFVFGGRKRETIICLPQAFSRNIESLKYHIEVKGFDKPFYGNAYLISKDGGEYRISSLEGTQADNTVFDYTMYPNTIAGEKAYYFKIGTSEEDTEKPQ